MLLIQNSESIPLSTVMVSSLLYNYLNDNALHGGYTGDNPVKISDWFRVIVAPLSNTFKTISNRT